MSLDGILTFLYYSATEGIWGASLGKALWALRVVGPKGNVPGIGRAMARVVLFQAACLPLAVMNVRSTEFDSFWQPALGSLPFLLFFSTCRRKNGFAALHDRATNTRVVIQTVVESSTTAKPMHETVRVDQNAERIGPYRVLSRLDEREGEELLLGYDLHLRRNVWIRRLAEQASSATMSFRAIRRHTRLRWVAGNRLAQGCWEAYEAPLGQPMLELIIRPQPWRDVRIWLVDLAQELLLARQSDTVPPILGLDRVWITADGRAKLLDFPAPGTDAARTEGDQLMDRSGKLVSGCQSTSTSAGTAVPFPANLETVSKEQVFLKRVATAALEGTPLSDVLRKTPVSSHPLPFHAHEFLLGLPQFPSLDSVVIRLNALLQQSPQVSRARRAALIGLCMLPILFILGVECTTDLEIRQQRKHAGSVLELRDLVEKLQHQSNWGEQKHVSALETYIAGHLRGVVTNPVVWNDPMTRRQFTPEQRRLSEQVIKVHAVVSERELALATAFLGSSSASRLRLFQDTIVTLALYACFFVLPSLASALILRGGIVMLTLGVGVSTKDGQPASRWRVFARTVLAWLPLLPISASISYFVFAGGSPAFLILCLSLYSICIGRVLECPSSGFQDLLSGTRLVPK
jgi:hypothetical protein